MHREIYDPNKYTRKYTHTDSQILTLLTNHRNNISAYISTLATLTDQLTATQRLLFEELKDITDLMLEISATQLHATEAK